MCCCVCLFVSLDGGFLGFFLLLSFFLLALLYFHVRVYTRFATVCVICFTFLFTDIFRENKFLRIKAPCLRIREVILNYMYMYMYVYNIHMLERYCIVS